MGEVADQAAQRRCTRVSANSAPHYPRAISCGGRGVLAHTRYLANAGCHIIRQYPRLRERSEIDPWERATGRIHNRPGAAGKRPTMAGYETRRTPQASACPTIFTAKLRFCPTLPLTRSAFWHYKEGWSASGSTNATHQCSFGRWPIRCLQSFKPFYGLWRSYRSIPTNGLKIDNLLLGKSVSITLRALRKSDHAA